MNRCLTEGRQALSVRLAGIEGGVECVRPAPLLSALADGEADADALALLRPHLKTCLSCRARLREFRAAPAHVAALVPVVLVAVDGGGARGLVESAVGTLHQKAESVVGAPQQKVEGIPAVAGGGTAVDQLANHHGPPQRAAVQQAESPSDESAAGPDPSPSLPPAAVE